MATTTEAPASTTAEGPTTHTQNQTPRFSPYQLRMLHGGINGNRVRNLRGMSHLEAWDVRRQLIRIFGFGGFDIETISLDLVAQNEKKTGDKSRWTVVYRAQVRLIVKDSHGTPIGYFDDGAAGDSVNQPSLGDAHDMAMKTAFSQALKRCAVNLGDQFGLSLYNDGSKDAVVGFSAAHPPQEWKPQAQPPEPEPVDPPVRPEPTAQQESDDSTPGPMATPAAPAPATAARTPRVAGQAKDGKQAVLNTLYAQAIEHRHNRDVLTQVRGAADEEDVIDWEVPGPPPERQPMSFRDLLEMLESAHAQRSAA
ncbi:Rad52/Rad22 family DNA repair protein [[Kitasatospora] papulosa]|uniref:Rad52/Rad22 family DNA repair protein n=1 Tax=[Kitasatospora] papulosa TaxID=1464011 RepID=UPI0036925958